MCYLRPKITGRYLKIVHRITLQKQPFFVHIFQSSSVHTLNILSHGKYMYAYVYICICMYMCVYVYECISFLKSLSLVVYSLI